MQFRFYVTDLHEGRIYGTDSEEEATDLSASEDHFVLDSENGVWLLSNGEKLNIDHRDA